MRTTGHTYCWAVHPSGASHCTLTVGHSGNHYNWYADGDRREWPAAAPTPHPAAAR